MDEEGEALGESTLPQGHTVAERPGLSPLGISQSLVLEAGVLLDCLRKPCRKSLSERNHGQAFGERKPELASV